MNLIIDRGNTHTKFAVMHGNDVIDKRVCDNPNDDFLLNLKTSFHIENAIFCSVAGHDEPLLALLARHFPQMLTMPHNLRFPLTFDYDLNELGADRIAAAVGARVLVPHGNLFVVDAGTCITYDSVSDDNRFEVGNIAPGYEMRLRAMHQFTGKLPLLEPTEPTQFMAQGTAEAMRAGAFNGILFELEGYLRHFEAKNRHFQIILTGGTSNLLQNKIKSCIFAPHLVLIGLNEILEQNNK